MATELKHRRPRVIIVGAGFAGTHAAQALARLPVDVTVVDRRNHFTFQPLLYQVGLAVLSPADIASPVRTILRHNSNTEVLMDEAVAFDLPGRRVRFRSGAEMAYDYLMLATGATHSYFGNDKWEPLAPGLKTIEDAIAASSSPSSSPSVKCWRPAPIIRSISSSSAAGLPASNSPELSATSLAASCATTFAISTPPNPV
jgi:hypothetical protein